MPFIIYLLALAVFAQGTSEFMLAGLLPDIAHGLGVSVPMSGLLTSFYAIGIMFGAPIAAALGRRWSPRWSLSLCLLVFITAHIAGALSTDFNLLLITRVCAAIANAGFLAITLSTVAALVAPDRQARALAVILSGSTMALIIGVPGGAALGAAWGWRSVFWIVAVATGPALLAVLRFAPVQGPGSARTGPLGAELRVLLRPAVIRAMVLALMVNGATFCAFTYLAPLVTDAAGLTEAQLPVVLAVFGIGALAGVTLAGRFADEHHRLITAAGGALLALSWVLLALTRERPVVFYALIIVLGLLSFGVGSTLIGRVLHAAGAAPSMSGSYATSALNVGAALGPVLGGLTLAHWGTVGPVVASAALTLAMLITASLSRSSRNRQVTPGD